MPTSQKTQEIAAKFQKYLKNKDKTLIEAFSLEQLEDADVDLGWRDKDSSHRMALKSRINELRQEEKERKDTRRHNQNLLMGWLSLFVVIIVAVLGWLFFGQ